MRPTDFEQAVFELEQVRIVIRAPLNADLRDYDFDRKAAANASITDWLEQRILPRTNGHSVAVVAGDGTLPHGRTRMEKLRASYTA